MIPIWDKKGLIDYIATLINDIEGDCVEVVEIGWSKDSVYFDVRRVKND